MNVYDFDDTIYNGDSTVDFFLYELIKHPKLIKYIPKQLKMVFLYKIHRKSKEEMKEAFYSFLKDIDTKKEVKLFWNKKEKNIKQWYLERQKKDDLIISASPEFLLKPICERFGIKNLICSKVNPNTGKLEGKNCKGANKVYFFKNKFNDTKIDEFYSDSLSDEPLAKMAEKAYIVNNNDIEKWPTPKEFLKKKIFRVLINVIFVLSCFMFNCISMRTFNKCKMPFKYCMRLCLVVSLIMAVIYCKYNPNLYRDFKKSKRIYKILAVLGTIGIFRFYEVGFYQEVDHINMINKLKIGKNVIAMLGITIIPFVMIMLCKIYEFLGSLLRKIYKENGKICRIESLITGIVLIFILILSFCKANLLYTSTKRVYDIVYTSDTIALLKPNSWLNICAAENDLRQPLFAVFSAPFVAPLYGITCWFNGLSNLVYPITIGIANIIILVLLINIVVSFMYDETSKSLFFVLYLSTFAPLLFSITLEQYVPAAFWLLLFIYMYISKLENKKISFVGAVGTLLTSGILFPLLLNSSDKLVKKIKDLINYFLYTMFVILLFGRLDVLLTSIDKIMFLKRFSGSKVSFINRFIQYTHFIPNCFIALNDSPTEQNAWGLTGLHSINIFGILIFIVCIISFIIYKKDKITRLSFIWITYSFFILCVLGWGTAENGLTLYILYFSWAFVILIFNFVKYILEKLKLQKFSKQIIITIAISMLIYNLYDISKMIIYLSKFKV